MRILNFLTTLFLFSSLFFSFGCANESLPPAKTVTAIGEPSMGARISAPDADASEPAIATTKDGAVVVWVEHNANKTADVFLQKFDAEGKSTGDKIRINPNAGEATAWRGDPPTIAVGGDDNAIYVGWTQRVKNETASGTDLLISVSRDGGKTFAAPAKVNDDAAPASHGMHSLAVEAATGKIYVAWLDERNIKAAAHARHQISTDFAFVKVHHTPTPAPKKAEPEAEPNSEVFFSISTDGGKTFSPNKKLASEVCPCCKTDVLAAPEGKVFVSWRQVVGDDFRHIAVASSHDGGNNFGAPAIVSDDRWQIAACPVSGAPLAVGADNALQIVWFTAGAAGAPGFYQSQSTDDGKTFAPRRLIAEEQTPVTPVLINGESSGARLVWATGDGKIKSSATTNYSIENVGDGDLPAAASSPDGKHSFVAFVKKENGKRGVWLTKING